MTSDTEQSRADGAATPAAVSPASAGAARSAISRWWPLLLLLAVTTLAYSPLWDVAFSWDDEALVVDNQVTGDLGRWREFFTRDLWSTTRLSSLQSGYYRPLMLLSLAADRALFGLSSTAAHVHSLLWHLSAVAALYGLLLRFSAPRVAVMGATLFALHPVQSEVMALVAARNDAMAATFLLCSLLCLAPRRVGWVRLGLAAVCALCGLLSKESAGLAFVMLAALDMAQWRRLGHWTRYVSLLGSLCIYLPLRRLADLDAAIAPTSDAFSLLAANALSVVSVYAKLIVWPWPLTPARHINYLPALGDSLIGLVLLTLLLGLALRRAERRGLVIAGMLWALATFVPSLAATLDKGLLGERYLYLPISGLALAWVAVVSQPPRWAPVALGLPCLFVLHLRLPLWADSRTVWEDAHAVAPTAFTAGGLAWYYHRDRDFTAANRLFLTALEGQPPYRDVCDMVVMSHLEARQAEEAVRVGKWAIEQRGCDPSGLITHHLAIGLAGTGQWEEAAAVVTGRPGGPEGPAIVVLAAIEARRGRLDVVAEAAKRRAPTDPTFLQRTARLLTLAGDEETAGRISALITNSGVPSTSPP